MLEVVVGAASAAAIVYAGFSAMAPASQLYGRTLIRAANPRSCPHLDDGPMIRTR